MSSIKKKFVLAVLVVLSFGGFVFFSRLPNLSSADLKDQNGSPTPKEIRADNHAFSATAPADTNDSGYWFHRLETSSDLYQLLEEMQKEHVDNAELNLIAVQVVQRCRFLSDRLSTKVHDKNSGATSPALNLQLIREALLNDSVKPLGSRTYANPKALEAYLNRCERIIDLGVPSSLGMSVEAIQAEDLIAQAISSIDSKGVDATKPILEKIISTKSSTEIAGLGALFSRLPKGIDPRSSSIDSLAWSLAACEFGPICERGSLTMLAFCSVSTNYCDETTDFRSLIGNYFANDVLLLADTRARNIVYLLRNGEIEQFLRLEHRQ